MIRKLTKFELFKIKAAKLLGFFNETKVIDGETFVFIRACYFAKTNVFMMKVKACPKDKHLYVSITNIKI